jgi:YidC/Oxa1 family membrane protein insertase
MDTQRVILFIVFSFSIFLLWDAWQKEQRRPIATPQTAESPVPPISSAPPAAPQEAKPVLESAGTVSVKTDLVSAEISTLGGDVRRLELLTYEQQGNSSQNFVLFEASPAHTYVVQSGLIGESLPNHRTRYTAKADSYELDEGADRVEIVLESANQDGGIGVKKIFTFYRGSYLIDIAYEIHNRTGGSIQPYAYYQLLRDAATPEGESALIPTYTGVAVYTEQDKFQKVPFADIDKGKTGYPAKGADGWIGMIQHYFVAAWLPAQDTPHEFYTRKLDSGLYSAGVVVPAQAIAAGETAKAGMSLYAGPQEHKRLRQLEARAPGLTLTVDYGWLTIIAAPLFWLLSWINGWVHNWGVSIILLTIIVKGIFYWPSAASYRSMARMRVVAPKLQKIKEQYGDDKQRMQQAMMDLYRNEKINPLGGCLPILIQIPVFIALYWVLLASVELRQAPFALWIDDLSAPDPYFILPVLMGISMIIQSKLTPAPPDPVQARIMKIMPIAFSVFFFFFPAGLVLYWLVNNILSIAQQWSITRTMEREHAAHQRR